MLSSHLIGRKTNDEGGEIFSVFGGEHEHAGRRAPARDSRLTSITRDGEHRVQVHLEDLVPVLVGEVFDGVAPLDTA
jgi:hypothetical protein